MASMDNRRSLLAIIPVGTWLGAVMLVIMAFVPALRFYVAFAAIFVIGYTVFHVWQRLRVVEVPTMVSEQPVKVQRHGPDFKEVLRAIPDPVMIIAGFEPNDIAGRWIIFANAAAQAIFKIEREDAILVSAIRTPEVLECVDEALFGRISTQTVFDTNGGARDQYWHAFASPLPFEDGAQRLALLVIRDETDTRRMERMRADFLANASHELRTPLASLTGFVETLRGPARDDEKARDKFLSIMAAQADRMGRLINDLLSLSRIELNEHVPPSGEADLTLAVRDVVDGLTLIAQQKKVRLVVNAPKPGLYPIIGDRDQILQVAQNLIDNALKYAPVGSEVIIDIAYDLTLVQALATSDTKAAKLVLLRPDRNVHDYYAKVTVRDHGPGIRREFLPRLAERFYRVEGQKSGDRLGTGLGLAIVKHIVNRHRGGLVVESQGQVTSSGDDILERDNVAAIPASAPPTFTAFSAYFPQKHAYGAPNVSPRLVETPALKDAG